MDEDLKHLLIPREAYRFWPSETIAKRGFGRFAHRMIFSRQEFSDLEEEALAEMYEIIETDAYLRERVAGTVEKAELMRVIYASEWDMKAVKERLRRYVEWKESIWREVTEKDEDGVYAEILNTGGFYTYGRDCYYRPILHLKPLRLTQVM